MKIYIIAEGKSITGGPETLHQIANVMRNNNYDAYLYYVDTNDIEVPNKFKEYNVKVTDTIEDDYNNILIVPESYTEYLYRYKKIKKAVLWLSLDFYLNNRWINRVKLFCNVHKVPIIFSPMVFLYLFFSRKLKYHLYKNTKNDKTCHFYNCEYVNEYLKQIGIDENRKSYVCGPLRNEYFNNENFLNYERKNYVLYNPKKGIEFTKKIIEANQDEKIKFIPIQNMKSSEVKDLMLKSKCYIDFGYFPGPERVPREAVMLGLNIITSKIGSANNDFDVKIPKEFKFEDNENEIPSILNLIYDMVYNYEKYTNKFSEYREKIINQKERFENDVINLVKVVEREYK